LVQRTLVQLPCAPTATILITPTHALRTVTTARSGSLTAFSSVPDHGSMAPMDGTTSMDAPDSMAGAFTGAGSTADVGSMGARAFMRRSERTADSVVVLRAGSTVTRDSMVEWGSTVAEASTADAGKP